jgi:hypothetical protein
MQPNRSPGVRRELSDATLGSVGNRHLAVDWDIRDEIEGKRTPSAIAGQSWYGLNSGAKRSLDRNYLPLAEATGDVEVLPLHVVAHRGYDICFPIRGVMGPISVLRPAETVIYHPYSAGDRLPVF